MPDTTTEQDNTITEDEIVSLLDDSPASAPQRKGYDDYVREAEAKAAKEAAPVENEGDTGKEDDGYVIPEKFKGKSTEEIVQSYLELESNYGRRNNEVGSLRKLTDQLLELSTNEKTENKPQEEPVTVDGLLENPGDSINRAVESNPKLKAIEERLAREDQAKSLAKFEEKFPDWKDTLNTESFQKWVMDSPVRQRMYAEANAKYDYETGAELFEMYDLVKGKAVKEAEQTRNSDARQAVKSQVTETGGSGEGKPKPKFKRTELIELKLRNPQKYEAMREQIMQAYADGRVV